MPGATPMSTTQRAPCSLARASWSRASSAMKEMSTQAAPALAMVSMAA